MWRDAAPATITAFAQSRIPRWYSPGVLPSRDLALALGAVVAVACSDSPTAPSPYPQVAGTYSGEVSLRGEGISEILGTLTATVVQVGNQLTITARMTGLVNRTVTSRGTIGLNGGFGFIAGRDGGPPFRFPDCGVIQPTALLIVFAPDFMVFFESATSQFCGDLEVGEGLTRQ